MLILNTRMKPFTLSAKHTLVCKEIVSTSKTSNSSLTGLASRLYINESHEYKLRRELLTNMDVMVRPVESPSDVVNVSFSMTIRSLSDLVS